MKMFMSIVLFGCLAIFGLMSPSALASVDAAVVESSFDLLGLATILFGDNAPVMIGWISFALVVWSQLRQLIPARWLALLPAPIVTVLEWLASNLGQSANHFENNPNLIKKMK